MIGSAKAAHKAADRRLPCGSCAEHSEGLSRRIGDMEIRLIKVEDHINESSAMQKAIDVSIKAMQSYFERFQADVDGKFKMWDDWKDRHTQKTGELMQQCVETNEIATKTQDSVNKILQKISEKKGFFSGIKWLIGCLFAATGLVISNLDKLKF